MAIIAKWVIIWSQIFYLMFSFRVICFKASCYFIRSSFQEFIDLNFEMCRRSNPFSYVKVFKSIFMRLNFRFYRVANNRGRIWVSRRLIFFIESNTFTLFWSSIFIARIFIIISKTIICSTLSITWRYSSRNNLLKVFPNLINSWA